MWGWRCYKMRIKKETSGRIRLRKRLFGHSMSLNDLDRQYQDALGVRGWPLVIYELLLLTLLLTKRQI